MHICERDVDTIESILFTLSQRDERAAEALNLIQKVKAARADPALIQATADTYGTDELEIDDDAGTSKADDGTWVQAWVWMPNEEDDDADVSESS